MKHAKIYSRKTAAPAALPVYDAITEKRGFVPNVMGVYGGTPDALIGIAALTASYGSGTLTPAEREIVLLTTSVHNKCRYCVAGHTYFAKDAGLSLRHVAALRDGRRLSDRKLDALRGFAKSLADKRGHSGTPAYNKFLSVGYSHEQALEVIMGVAVKTLSNMTASLFSLPLDAAFVPYAWSPEYHPKLRAA